MEIKVQKPTPEQIEEMVKLPTWGCEVSTFDWYYDDKETCYLLEGEVRVTYEGGEARFGQGDLVILPKDMSCVWHVTKPVRKHYKFR